MDEGIASIIENGQKVLSYSLDELKPVREKTIAELEKAGVSVDEAIGALKKDEASQFTQLHLSKNNVSYLLWRLNANLNTDKAEQFGHIFLQWSKFLELYLVKNSKDKDNQASLRAHYLSQAEVCVWLSQYYANDVRKWITYFYRAQLRLLLLEGIKIGDPLDELQKEQMDSVTTGIKCTQSLVRAQVGELEALEIYRSEFLSDIHSLSDEVIDEFKDDDYRRIELLHTIEGFRDAYKKAQLLAITTHKGLADSLNRKYYREFGSKKLRKLLVELQSQHLKAGVAVQSQDLFGLVASLQEQENLLQEVNEIFGQLKAHFKMTSKGLELLQDADLVNLEEALKDEELQNDFSYSLKISRDYVDLLNAGKSDLNRLIKACTHDIHRHYYSQLYNYLERLFLACKTISSGLIKHTYQGTLGKVGSILGVISGPLRQIPVAGSVLGTVVQVAGTVAVETDYKRTTNTLKEFDQVFAADTLKYLANYLACELVNVHYHQLPNILAVSNTMVGKATGVITREMQPNVFDRVSEYFCSRVFAIMMGSDELYTLLENANKSVNFRGHQINFVHDIGNLILEELSHYDKPGVIEAVNKFLLKSHVVTWQDPFDVNKQSLQSLHDIFGVAHVLTASPHTYKHKNFSGAPAMARFGFIQSSRQKIEARKSLEDITPKLRGPGWQMFNPLHNGEVSFPALYEQLQKQGETIRQQQQVIERLMERVKALEGPAKSPHDNSKPGESRKVEDRGEKSLVAAAVTSSVKSFGEEVDVGVGASGSETPGRPETKEKVSHDRDGNGDSDVQLSLSRAATPF